ncbi:hypothetical protein [Ralstonia sp. ASV6]|uniref:hypothetical protein n=1 Tax=Ralstonia sp. ASV6 TaxID=2795124 RepID=UPI0018EBA9E5|nr:hypothetical protein [Ralstonia sp. ASV6]
MASEISVPNDADVQCPRCLRHLRAGKAFVGYRFPDGVTTDEAPPQAALQDCLKCQSCGYSEELPPLNRGR